MESLALLQATKRTFHRMLQDAGFDVVHSVQNIELLKIYEAIRGGDQGEAAATEASGRPAAAGSSPGSLRSTAAFRRLKTIVNSVGSLIGVGDELTAIAVKRAARSTTG
jgi:hypothetical protein